MEELILAIQLSEQNYNRNLVSSTAVRQPQDVSSRWKNALWEKDSIEPAMLRVPVIMIIMLFLWGINIVFLERNRLQYYNVLNMKAVSTTNIFITAILLTVGYALNMTLLSTGLNFSVESGVTTFYFIIFIISMLPNLPGQEMRHQFFRTFLKVFFPGTTISFPEVLLADALTSMSKVFKDIGVTLIALYAHHTSSDIVIYHETGMIIMALLTALPYWVRIRQCSVQFFNATDIFVKVPIFLNIVKYASAFPPIGLAAAASLGYYHPSLPSILAVTATINSLYSYLWDIVMDWGVLSFSRTGHTYVRQRASFPFIFYIFAIITNFILRFSWAANRIAYVSRMHASHVLLMVELVEVFRRTVWYPLRIEWEVIVQQERAAELDVEQADKMLVKPSKLTNITT